MPVYDPETLQALETARARLDTALGAKAAHGQAPVDAETRIARRARQLVGEAIDLLHHADAMAQRAAQATQHQGSAAANTSPSETAASEPPMPGAGQTEQAQVSFLVRGPPAARQPAAAATPSAAAPKPALGAMGSKEADVTIVEPHAPAFKGKRPPQRPDAVARFLKALTGA
ncbi:MAG TPA: hypothetical protein VG900_00270 [Hyphomicrobiaceae bacterium]|nr:hypothetical protein [Hyphomicrobiaceae bacterium]